MRCCTWAAGWPIAKKRPRRYEQQGSHPVPLQQKELGVSASIGKPMTQSFTAEHSLLLQGSFSGASALLRICTLCVLSTERGTYDRISRIRLKVPSHSTAAMGGVGPGRPSKGQAARRRSATMSMCRFGGHRIWNWVETWPPSELRVLVGSLKLPCATLRACQHVPCCNNGTFGTFKTLNLSHSNFEE